MRLWTVHPQYLDTRGLVALWREALLAQAVIRGRTRGYRHHPQLDRFREQLAPRSAINAYLQAVHAESVVRGYRFDRSKAGRAGTPGKIAATTGQLDYEWKHLLAKLRGAQSRGLPAAEGRGAPASTPALRSGRGPRRALGNHPPNLT
jgi:hypothetical protein